MNTKIHQQHEKYTSAKEILLHLQELFGEHSRTTKIKEDSVRFRDP